MAATLDNEVVELSRANTELRRRLDEALAQGEESEAQKAAMVEILEAINASSGDLAPVFDAILERALRLCEAAFGEMHSFDGENLHTVALRNVPKALAEVLTAAPIRPDPERSFLGRATCHGLTIHDADLTNEQPYLSRTALAVASAELGGIRTFLHVPLLKDNTVVGVLTVFRQEVRPFSEAQIALLQCFAGQAAIAMENARLITETREALEQQTATAEVLQVINSSPGDLTPVFDAMLEKAMRLCEAAFGNLWIYDGERLHAAAIRGASTAYAEFLTSAPHEPGPGEGNFAMMHGAPFVHVFDAADSEGYRMGEPLRRTLVDMGVHGPSSRCRCAGMTRFLAPS
jgi:transcriptional regulator with GAF, ATPase, and Fis domain